MSAYGLAKRASRPQVRWAMDNVGPGGYAHLLTEVDRKYLERFNREYYQADSRALNAPDALHDEPQRKAIYRAQNAATRDMHSLGRMVLGSPDYARLAEGSIPEERGE